MCDIGSWHTLFRAIYVRFRFRAVLVPRRQQARPGGSSSSSRATTPLSSSLLSVTTPRHHAVIAFLVLSTALDGTLTSQVEVAAARSRHEQSGAQNASLEAEATGLAQVGRRLTTPPTHVCVWRS